MRTAFIGRTLDGHYVDGLALERDLHRRRAAGLPGAIAQGGGHWSFRGHVFCTLYDPGQGLAAGGCWTAIQASTNCYEFYLAGFIDAPDRGRGGARPARRLGRRAAWRQERALHLRGARPTA